MKPTLLAVDGNNIAMRAFYATINQIGDKKMMTRDGFHTGAMRAFISILAADIQKSQATHVSITFDHDSKSDKHEVVPSYKANRTKSEDVTNILKPQMKALKPLLRAAGFGVYCKRGIEGDEVTATVVTKYVEEFGKRSLAYIASNDKDFAQLVDKRVMMLKPKLEVWGRDEVIENMGVPPEKVVDYLILMGDKVDNIPGVYKCGGKTAAKLLASCSSAEDIDPNKLTPALKKNYLEARKMFHEARYLVELRTDRDVSVKFNRTPDEDTLDDLCDMYQFSSTRSELKRAMNGVMSRRRKLK